MAKITLGLVVLLAVIAWAANPRACCPRDSTPSALMFCQVCAESINHAEDATGLTMNEPGMPVKSALKCSDPIPRSGLFASDTMPFSSSSILIFIHGLVTARYTSPPDQKPESVTVAPLKHPPRL